MRREAREIDANLRIAAQRSDTLKFRRNDLEAATALGMSKDETQRLTTPFFLDGRLGDQAMVAASN